MKSPDLISGALALLLMLASTSAQVPRRAGAPQQPGARPQVRATGLIYSCRAGECLLTYSGDVEARTGPYVIHADEVVLRVKQGRLVASGNVMVAEGKRRSTGSRLELDYVSGQVIAFDPAGFRGRKAKPKAKPVERNTKLDEAIRKAYEDPAEALRRAKDSYDTDQGGDRTGTSAKPPGPQ